MLNGYNILGENLPWLPVLDETVTENNLERKVERLMDRADRMLLAGLCSQEQYDGWTKRLNQWANDHLDRIIRAA